MSNFNTYKGNPRNRTDYANLKDPHMNYLQAEAEAYSKRIKDKLDRDGDSELFQRLLFKELAKLAPKPYQEEKPSFNSQKEIDDTFNY